MNKGLWDDAPVRRGEYFVFHDESIPDNRWLLIGLTFVKTSEIYQVRDCLTAARRQEDYDGEVHFADLPKSFEGQFGGKARLARGWMNDYEKNLADAVSFSCLALDKGSPAYIPRKFGTDFHAYNRFTAMALKAGISWHLGPKGLEEVGIDFVSDAKDRTTRPDQGLIDNFESYLPYRAALDSHLSQFNGNRYPRVELRIELFDSAREDLLQLTDLLLGATQMALVAKAQRRVKREIGEFVIRWCEDLRRPPWQQQLGLYRRFNVWAFPDKDGKVCDVGKIRFELPPGVGQLSLF